MDRKINVRVLALIAGATLLGAVSAALALWSVQGSRDAAAIRPLVWTVFGTPFATFWGYLLARRSQGWQAAFWAFMIYFLGILIAARIEWIVLGTNAAAYAGSNHTLYFQLTIGLQLLGGLALALHAARHKGTIPTNPAAVIN